MENTNVNPVQPVTNPAPVPKKPMSLRLIIVLVIFFVFVTGVGAYYLGTQGYKLSLISDKQKPKNSGETNTLKPTATNENKIAENNNVNSSPLFTGQLKKLTQNLQLFKLTEDDKLNNVSNNFVYYEAGQFTRGELKGYTRIIAMRPPMGPGPATIFTLATKDFQIYVLDDPNNLTQKFTKDNYENPYFSLDQTKVTKAITFDSNTPKTIDLDKNFSLFFKDFPTEYSETTTVDINGYKISEEILITDFSSYRKLSSPFSNLTFYFKPYIKNSYYDKMTQKEKDLEDIRASYFIGDNSVYAIDETGLPKTYFLTTPSIIISYNDKMIQFEAAMQKYYASQKAYDEKKTTILPQYPSIINSPSLGFTKADLVTNDKTTFFNTYSQAVPGGCAVGGGPSYMVNLKDSDLSPVGSAINLSLYKLIDTHHPLYTLAYKNKTDFYEDTVPTLLDGVTKSIKKPTLEEYVAKNPLLFIKDYWNNWVMLGEFDIQLPGGCGKPVVYLYPEKDTEVSVNFLAPVQFTTQIPEYDNGWLVLAHPNGTLNNLRANNCQNIDSSKKGSEYAKEACLTNNYPYLFWAGNISSVTYPKIDSGFIVAKSEVQSFLNSKLSEMGLNNNEKADFLSYWIPEILGKEAPYYRLSFLQTNQLNELFPMKVSPTPNTVFRIFLDWLPLTSKPETQLKAQSLEKLVRNGFTLVEWGGLKRF